MQLFDYKAKDFNGQLMKGKVEARDIQAAAQTLREKQYVVIDLKPANQGASLFGSFANGIGSADIVTFTQQLSTMINAGLPLSDGMSILQLQSKPSMAKVLSEIERDIQSGSTFSDALAARKGVFSKIYISAIRAGEASGKLDEVMDKLAISEEKRHEFAAKTKGALVYPVIVLVVMFIVMAVMMVVVVPKLTSMFDEFNVQLPMVTKLLISFSRFAEKFWWVFGIVIAGAVYGLRSWYGTKQGRQILDTWMLKMPVYGKLTTQVALSDVTRTLALLVGSGISILEALDIVTTATNNVVFERSLRSATEGVEKGLPLATMLAREQVFPPLLSQMVAVGEETGKLSEILIKVSQYYESESEHAVKNLTTAIEPLIMVVLGAGVMFLVFAIMMPIYQLTSSF